MNNELFELIKSDLISAKGYVAIAACSAYDISINDFNNNIDSRYGKVIDNGDIYIKIFNDFLYVYNQMIEHGLDVKFNQLHWKWRPCLDGVDNPFNILKPAIIIESQDNTI